jgi:hypothetical protein
LAAANRSKIASVLAALACRDSLRAIMDLYARRSERQVDTRLKRKLPCVAAPSIMPA